MPRGTYTGTGILGDDDPSQRRGYEPVRIALPTDSARGPLSAFGVVSVQADYLICNPVGPDGTANAAIDVYVLKPPTLQRTPWDATGPDADGVSFVYASNTQRDATDGSDTETQKITPNYQVYSSTKGNVIFAAKVPKAQTLVGGAGAGQTTRWMDANVDGRAWAVIPAAGFDAILVDDARVIASDIFTRRTFCTAAALGSASMTTTTYGIGAPAATAATNGNDVNGSWRTFTSVGLVAAGLYWAGAVRMDNLREIVFVVSTSAALPDEIGVTLQDIGAEMDNENLSFTGTPSNAVYCRYSTTEGDTGLVWNIGSNNADASEHSAASTVPIEVSQVYTIRFQFQSTTLVSVWITTGIGGTPVLAGTLAANLPADATYLGFQFIVRSAAAQSAKFGRFAGSILA